MAYLITTLFPLASESDAWESGEGIAGSESDAKTF
jgi:hypothetical protein